MVGDIIFWVFLAVICGFLSYCACWNYKMFITVTSDHIPGTVWSAVRATMPLFDCVIFFVASAICLIKVAIILGLVRMAS